MINKNILRYSLMAAVITLTGCGSSAEKEKQYLEKAQASFKVQNYDKTRVELKNVLQINPKNTDALYLMAQLAEKDQDWKKMFGLLSALVVDKPDFLEAQIKLGKLFLFGGEPDKALEKSALVLAKNADNKEALVLKAAVLLQKNDKTSAQAIVTKVLSLNPGDLEATFLLAKLYSESKQYDEALKVIDAALTAHPDEINLALMKMQVLMTAGKGNVADNMVSDLLTRFSDQNALHYSMAKYYVVAKQLDKAEQVLRDLIAKKPAETEPKLALIEYFLSQKGEARAEESLLGFSKANPTNHEFSFALVSLYKEKPEKAIPVLNHIISNDIAGADGLKAKNMLAKFMLKQGDKAKAEQLIDEVIKVDAHNADALMMRSTLSVDTGKYESAIGDLRTVLRDQPESEKANILSARTHLKSGYLDLAQESLKNSLAINPGNIDVRKDLARMLAMKKDETAAISLLEDLGQAKQQNAEVLAMLVDLYARKTEWAKAEETAKSIAKVDNSGLAAFKLAQLYVAQKKLPAAVDAYNEALKLNPLGLDILAGLSNVYLSMGEAGKATGLLDKLLAEHPANSGLLNLQGVLYQNQKRFSDAERVFSTVISLAKTEEVGYRNLAAVYIVQNQFDQALKVYQQGLVALPQNVNLMQAVAMLYEKTAKPDAAIETYTAILKIKPDNKAAMNNLAAITAETTTDPKRLSDVLTIVKSFKDYKDPVFLDTFGWLSYLNGQLDDAVSALEKVVKLEPDFPEFSYHLAMAYAAKGRNEEAKLALQKALSKNSHAPWVDKATIKLKELS
ncbi:MAG: tetratricopeptide repeat protein [Methylococcales bacterium]|nr:tetratricopeptide repeat protein [Methylococcales bacterium]